METFYIAYVGSKSNPRLFGSFESIGEASLFCNKNADYGEKIRVDEVIQDSLGSICLVATTRKERKPNKG